MMAGSANPARLSLLAENRRLFALPDMAEYVVRHCTFSEKSCDSRGQARGGSLRFARSPFTLAGRLDTDVEVLAHFGREDGGAQTFS